MANPIPSLPDCAICLMGIEQEKHKKLACLHEFHFDCINVWINLCKQQQKNVSCPLCRHQIESVAGDQAIAPALQLIGPQANELRFDREIVLAAVRQNGRALQYALLRLDREIVLAAVRQNGWALQYLKK